MPQRNSSPDGWDSCPPGTFSTLAKRLNAQQRIRQLKTAAAATVAMLILVCTAVLVFPGSTASDTPDLQCGGISCTEVRKSLPDMLAGSTPPELTTRIQLHLAECPHCGELVRKMKESVQSAERQRSKSQASRSNTLISVRSF
ncbi:MAG: zf-HC2 domain-containing protein [Planctomyces sp.]|nr:zf-HC2 domain-containing protein [Planctomyces sp.]